MFANSVIVAFGTIRINTHPQAHPSHGLLLVLLSNFVKKMEKHVYNFFARMERSCIEVGKWIHVSLVMRKPFFFFFAYAKIKTQISFAVTAKLISAFVFATQMVQSLYFLKSKFQASSHLLWLCSPLCVRPGRKPRRQVFSQRGSYAALK